MLLFFTDVIVRMTNFIGQLVGLRIRIRYHNGAIVNFDNKGFSFTLQFALFRPQNQRSYQMYIPETAAFPPIG